MKPTRLTSWPVWAWGSPSAFDHAPGQSPAGGLDDGRFVPNCNGEVDNHTQIRRELPAPEDDWRGHSDTETILQPSRSGVWSAPCASSSACSPLASRPPRPQSQPRARLIRRKGPFMVGPARLPVRLRAQGAPGPLQLRLWTQSPSARPFMSRAPVCRRRGRSTAPFSNSNQLRFPL
jgi:hypothetical protein